MRYPARPDDGESETITALFHRIARVADCLQDPPNIEPYVSHLLPVRYKSSGKLEDFDL